MRVYNFSAGPAVLPEPVLQQAAAEMLDWQGSGMSVMEMSHRGPQFMAIHAQAQADLRRLLGLGDEHAVLFLQGGAIAENAIVPMNLIGRTGVADYVHTGEWSRRSIEEAGRFGRVHVAASAADRDFTYVPPQSDWRLSPDAAYVHVCTNETIGGVEYHWMPDTGDVPLVADMSSHLLSRPMDLRRFGVVYAGAQKNAGASGLTIVIVRRDLFGRALPITPSAFNWQLQAENDSMLNTPPTYSIYIAGLVFRWLLDQGGLAAIGERNRAKAALLYDHLDRSEFFSNPVQRPDRSLMNVPFRLRDARLDGLFLQGAEQRGLVQLKGHRVVGGMRASMYNAMPIEGVRALVDYLREFEQRHA